MPALDVRIAVARAGGIVTVGAIAFDELDELLNGNARVILDADAANQHRTTHEVLADLGVDGPPECSVIRFGIDAVLRQSNGEQRKVHSGPRLSQSRLDGSTLAVRVSVHVQQFAAHRTLLVTHHSCQSHDTRDRNCLAYP